MFHSVLSLAEAFEGYRDIMIVTLGALIIVLVIVIIGLVVINRKRPAGTV